MRHGYEKDYDPKVYATTIVGDSMAVQGFTESCDVNQIMARYLKTGIVDHVAKYQPQYGEVTGADFTQAMQTVANAMTMFEELPAKAREFFGGDAANFLDYVVDIEARDPEELYELGLLDPESDTAREIQRTLREESLKAAEEAQRLTADERNTEGDPIAPETAP